MNIILRKIIVQCILGTFILVSHPVNLYANEATEAQENYVCFMRYVCARYGEFAQKCSTAGNYNTCMRVMQNGGDSSNMCELSGRPLYSQMYLDDRKIADISDVKCLAVYGELKLAPFGYVPSFFNKIKKWLQQP